MKYTKLCALLLSLTPLISVADDTGTTQSIVFEPDPLSSVPQETYPPYDKKSDAQSTNGKTEDYCMGLLHEIEDLKGKPLRRTAARDRYSLECTSSQGFEYSQ